MIFDLDRGTVWAKEFEEFSEIGLGTALCIKRYNHCHEIALPFRRYANPMSECDPLREPRQEFIGRLGCVKISVDPSNLRFERAPTGSEKYFLEHGEQLAQILRRVVYPRQVAQQGSRGIRSHFPTP